MNKYKKSLKPLKDLIQVGQFLSNFGYNLIKFDVLNDGNECRAKEIVRE